MSVKSVLPGWMNESLHALVQTGRRALGWANQRLLRNHARPVFSFITAVLAGLFTGFLAGRFPYYPAEITWLLALAVAVVWLLKPAVGVVVTLALFLLPIAYNSLTLGLVFFLFIILIGIVDLWALAPYGFLVLAGITVVFLKPEIAILLPLAPLLAGLLGAKRGAVLGFFACFWAQALAVLAGRANLGLLATGLPSTALVTTHPNPVSSLLDFSWLTVQVDRGKLDTDLVTALFAPFTAHPVLLAQLVLWLATACIIGLLLTRPVIKKIPARYSAVLAGILVLGAGYLVLPGLFGEGIADAGAVILSVGVSGLLVGVVAPGLEIGVKALNTPSEKPAGGEASTAKGSSLPEMDGLGDEQWIEDALAAGHKPGGPGVAHDVFISYSSKDKAIADAVCSGLESRRIRCWMAPRDILPGSDFGLELAKAIKSSKVVVLIHTTNSNVSKYVLKEVERAVNTDVPIVPFRVEDVPLSESMGFFLGNLHWLDAMTPPLEQHLGRLAETVSVLIGNTME